jgi:hypothetical protein
VAIERADVDLKAASAALVALAEANVPVDVQELLVHGNPRLSVAPGALSKAMAAALKTYRSRQLE